MKQIKYKGKYITTSEEKINGHTYERTELIPNVHVMPVRDNKILLMNEYRNHEKDSRWKLITGWCEKENKNPLEHAQEELAEEVGMQAEYWEEIFDASVPNGTINRNTKYFLCKNISSLDQKIKNPDTGIVIDYNWFNIEDIFSMIEAKKIWPGQSILIALLCLRNLEK